MTIVSPMGQLRPVFADKNGKRLSGGKVFTYEPGTLTPKATYTDALNLIPNTNPIDLNESGEANIYLDGSYRVQIFDRYGILIEDNLFVEQPLVRSEFEGITQDLQAQQQETLDQFQAQANEVIAKGFFTGFATETELLASTPTVPEMRARADDTRKIWRWNRTSAEGVTPVTGTWTDTGLSDKDLAAVDATTKANAAEANAKTEAKEYINERVSKTLTVGVHPIIADPSGKCPLWLDEGRLGFTELEPSSQERVKLQMGLGNSGALNIVPIVVDPNGDCPLWIQKGLLNFAGIHANAVQLIKEQLGAIDPQKKNNTTNAAYPILSDGASLTQWKAKVSIIKSGIAQQVRLLITGDSWTEHKTITNEILPLVRTDLGEAGSGWINLGAENNQVDNISVSKAGAWAYRDLDATSSFPHSSGPDGFILTSTAAGDTLTVSNLSKGNKLTVFYGKADGAFKYSINGGAETTITSSASGATVQSTTIDVSADSNIVFTTLSGTVVLFGLYLRKSIGSGVEVSKVGNGSCTGQDYLKISPTAQANFNDYLKPDLVIIILGTNDYRKGHSVANYKAGISAMIDGYRTSNPNCGFILIAPANSNATPIIPLVDFRDAIYEIAQEKKCEFYNMHDDWELYSVENSNGMWNDSLHVSKSGAYRIAKKLFKNFLEV